MPGLLSARVFHVYQFVNISPRISENTENTHMASMRTSATMPPRNLCVVRDNWISKPSTWSMVVGNTESQLESKVVGRFMDRQFDFLDEISDEIISPPLSCSLDLCPYNETPIANRIVRYDDELQSPAFKSNSESRISRIASCSEVKRKQNTAAVSADSVKSRLNFQCNQGPATNFEAVFPDHPCKKVKRDVS